MESGSEQVLETNLDEHLIETEAKRKNLKFDYVNHFSIYDVRLKKNIKPKELVLFPDEENEELISSHKIIF